LIILGVASALAAFAMLPTLVGSLTEIRFRDFLCATYEPMLMAIATGKLFVVLPQITEKCEELLGESAGKSTASVLVPLAYPFPHIGKILAVLFVSFAGWYVGQPLTTGQTAVMATLGAISSFASPLVTIPYLLDQHRLPQDLVALFILPGFITTRLGDVVGVAHLMALTIIVTKAMGGGLRIHWSRIIPGSVAVVICLFAVGSASRWYLAHTVPESNLDERFLALRLSEPHEDVSVFRTGEDLPKRQSAASSVIQRMNATKTLRIGYHPEHPPYVFFNQDGELVGFDVALMHRLARRLQVRLEFVPYSQDTLIDQLETGEIDLAIGGVMILPERLRYMSFTAPYQSATMALLVRDHRRHEVSTWSDADAVSGFRLGATNADIAAAARVRLPNVEVVEIKTPQIYFEEDRVELDGLVMPAEHAAAWAILYPAYTLVIPEPSVIRPVGFAVSRDDDSWARLIDRWLEFERADGGLERLSIFWIEGGGTQVRRPRWCVLRDVLHWIP
jgi:ABC-type amino acid transport substrate-binding protein